MKTLNELKAQATGIVKFMATKLANGNVNPHRMKRLLDVLRRVCFDIAKHEPKTASAVFEVADKMYTELTDKAKRIVINKEIEMSTKEIQWDSTDCNDEDCDVSANTVITSENYGTPDPLDGNHTFTEADEIALEEWYQQDHNYEDYRIINASFEEPAYQSNDEFGNLAGHTYEAEDNVPKTVFKYNGKILGDNDDLPF